MSTAIRWAPLIFTFCAALAQGLVSATAVADGVRPARHCQPLSLPKLYEKSAPAVVTVMSQTIRPYRFTDRIERTVGSGIIFDAHGLILTNNHVVAGADTVQVTLDDGNTYDAKVIGTDALFDLAVLHINVPKGDRLPTLALGESSTLQIGDAVVAIGNPLGLDETLTHGIVSGLNRELPDTPITLSANLIQTDAAINPGNSGGPLLNRCGQVVGVNAEILAGAQNLGFAIPIDLAKSVLPSLLRHGHVIRPWVGFHGQLIDRDTAQILDIAHAPGLLVEAVDRGSPAARAGLTGGSHSIAIDGDEYLVGGDLVTSMNGVRLTSSRALMQATGTLKVGGTLRVTYYRGDRRRTASYKIRERPPLLDARLGIRMAQRTDSGSVTVEPR